MQRAREKSWQHVDGKVATVSALAAAMQPHVNFLVTAGLRVYSGISFGHDMHTDELEKASNLLFSLLEIDGRGGYFTQATMHDALREAVGKENMTYDMSKQILEDVLTHGPNGEGPSQSLSVDDAWHMIAFKLRVMLRHIREKCDTRNDHEKIPEAFSRLFAVMKRNARKSPSPPPSKRHKGSERLGKGPHPFPAYQKSEDDVDDENGNDGEDDSTVCVSKFFDGKVCLMLKGDGTITTADSYTAGSSGFVVAAWLAENTTMQTEVPNTFLKAGKLSLSKAWAWVHGRGMALLGLEAKGA